MVIDFIQLRPTQIVLLQQMTEEGNHEGVTPIMTLHTGPEYHIDSLITEARSIPVLRVCRVLVLPCSCTNSIDFFAETVNLYGDGFEF
jgi:hypothetical protein